MLKKLVLAAVVVAALTAGAGSAAAADGARGQTLAFAVADVQPGPPTADCPLFTLTFRLVPFGGGPAGTGFSCVQSMVGCDPFVVGCTQIVHAIFTLNLAAGSITADMRLRETFIAENRATTLDLGRITSGTGAYAGATGFLVGGGLITFTPTGIDARIVLIAHIL